MERHYFDLPVRVLVYKEGRETVAHALEMDLLGYGATEQEATEDLSQMIESQLSFAAHKGEADMAYFPAPTEFFDRWDDAQRTSLRRKVEADKATNMRTKALVMTFSDAELSKSAPVFARDRELVGA